MPDDCRKHARTDLSGGRTRIRWATPGLRGSLRHLIVATLLLTWAPAPAISAEKAPPLDALSRTYGALEIYRDRGTLEIIQLSDGSQITRRFRFTTRAGPGASLRVELEPVDGGRLERLVWWTKEGALWCWDATANRYGTVPSVSAGLSSWAEPIPGEALLVPALLLGEGPLASRISAEDIVTEPGQPCGDGTGALCRRHVVPLEDGALRLWVGERDGLVHRLETERETPAPELPAEGPGFAGVSAGYVWVQVEIDVETAAREPSDGLATESTTLVFTPPPEARRVDGPAPSAAVGAIAPPSLPSGVEPVEVFSEEIEVALFPVTVRVIDFHGRPVSGLGPEDFRATLKPTAGSSEIEVPIVAVDWLRPDRPWTEEIEELERELTPEQWRELGLTKPDPGQLVVIFVQSDFNAVRIKGHLSFLPNVRSMLHSLAADDRVAVVAFGSHLELWQDFTRDRETVYRGVEQAVRFGAVPEPPGSADPGGPSLAAYFDFQAAKEVGSVERALGVVADALEALAENTEEVAFEEKQVIFLGWGIGRHDGFGYTVNAQWLFPAIQTFYRSRASVHVLDVTPYEVERGGFSGVGPAHTLEPGLRMLADKTGGTFARTYLFPAQAWRGLVQTVSGYYVLQIDGNAIPAGGGLLTVELHARKGRILVTRPLRIFDRPESDLPPGGGRIEVRLRDKSKGRIFEPQFGIRRRVGPAP